MSTEPVSSHVIKIIFDATAAAQTHLLDGDAQRIPGRRRLRQAPQPMVEIPPQSLNGMPQN
jgi:hypothetical protein